MSSSSTSSWKKLSNYPYHESGACIFPPFKRVITNSSRKDNQTWPGCRSTVRQTVSIAFPTQQTVQNVCIVRAKGCHSLILPWKSDKAYTICWKPFTALPTWFSPWAPDWHYSSLGPFRYVRNPLVDVNVPVRTPFTPFTDVSFSSYSIRHCSYYFFNVDVFNAIRTRVKARKKARL